MSPNIVLIVCDDLGRFLGSYGVPTVQTPHVDALAADGVQFEQAFCTAPQCSPSRASLFTGRYPQSNGVMGLAHPPFNWSLHPGERHLAGVLKDAGYETAAVGKVHESSLHRAQRTILGFDEIVTEGVTDGRQVADIAMRQLDRLASSQHPFYLQIGFVEPHRLPDDGDEPGTIGFLGNHVEPDVDLGVTVPPYLVDDDGARLDVAELQGAARYVDGAVGAVLSRLRELDLEQETIVVVTTDHGVALPRAKCSLYDPGLEIALILRCPALQWTGGQVVDALVSNVDIVPTLLDALELPASDRVQGVSLMPRLAGDHAVAGRREIFGQLTYHDAYNPRRCVRTERYKLIAAFAEGPAYGAADGGWRPRATAQTPAVLHSTYSAIELYDLRRDPAEMNDLSGDPAYVDVKKDLLARLHRWMVDVGDPLLEGAVASPMHHATIAQLEDASSPPA